MAWTAATRGDYVRPNGSYASDVTDREWTLIAPLLPAARPGGRRRTTCLRPGGGRDLLPAADRLPVANAAAGLPAAQHRLRLFPGLDRGRGLGTRPRRALLPDPGAGGSRREPDRGDHRQPERKNRSGSPRNGRIRRGKAGQGPQAAPGHRHPRPDAAHRGPFRQRAGSRGAALVLDRITRRFPFLERIFADAGYQGPRVAAAAPRPATPGWLAPHSAPG